MVLEVLGVLPVTPNKLLAGFVCCCWSAPLPEPRVGVETAGEFVDSGLEVRAFPKRADGAVFCCPKEVFVCAWGGGPAGVVDMLPKRPDFAVAGVVLPKILELPVVVFPNRPDGFCACVAESAGLFGVAVPEPKMGELLCWPEV